MRGFVHPLFQISDPEFDLRKPLALWNCRRGEDCRRRAPMDESDAAKPQRDHEGRGLTKNLSMDDPRNCRTLSGGHASELFDEQCLVVVSRKPGETAERRNTRFQLFDGELDTHGSSANVRSRSPCWRS